MIKVVQFLLWEEDNLMNSIKQFHKFSERRKGIGTAIYHQQYKQNVFEKQSPYDNTKMESFYRTLKRELINDTMIEIKLNKKY